MRNSLSDQLVVYAEDVCQMSSLVTWNVTMYPGSGGQVTLFFSFMNQLGVLYYGCIPKISVLGALEVV